VSLSRSVCARHCAPAADSDSGCCVQKPSSSARPASPATSGKRRQWNQMLPELHVLHEERRLWEQQEEQLVVEVVAEGSMDQGCDQE
jgi:hypothetical protein